MATKNIFEFLDSDNEQQQQSQNKAPRQRQRKQNQEQLGQKVNNDLPERQRKEIDNKHKKPYHNNRREGDNNRPARRNRSKDRHVSGTGRDTQQRHFRKGGAGKGNVGTAKDEEQRGEEQQVEQPVEESSEEEEEVEDNTLTLDQYYEKQGIQQQSQEEKKQQAKKIDEADLKKEKLTIVQSRQKVDRQANQKKAQSHYKPTYQGELGDQINFTTGLVPEKKPKKAKQPVAEGEQAEKTEEKPRQQQRGNQRPAQQQRKPNQKRGQGFKADTEDFPGL